MSDQACPLPSTPREKEAQAMRRMLAGQRIAVVGLSDDPARPSHGVAQYLRSVGKEIIPVNPTHATVMGLKCYESLRVVPGPIDVVDVFRRPEHCPQVVRDVIAVGAKGVWLQSGITSDEARRLAEEAGIDLIQDRCMKVEHMRQSR